MLLQAALNENGSQAKADPRRSSPKMPCDVSLEKPEKTLSNLFSIQ